MVIEGRALDDRYVLGEVLGRGGMAEVRRGTDRVLDRTVAVKILGDWLAHDASFAERFRREALAAARISHPNLVAVYDAGSEGELQYIVMEYVAGETLADALRRDGPIDPARAVEIASAVADALEAAHGAGIVHRDVKPGNVMIGPDGRVKLMDLGIARGVEGERITRTTSILGTASYVSPEQARGDAIDHRSDLYSLGCVLYEMVAGRPPFLADNPVAVAYQHVHETPASPSSLRPGLPPALVSTIDRAMQKDPDARYGSAAEMRSALRTVDGGGAVAATAPQAPVAATAPLPVIPPTAPLRRPRHRRRRAPWLLAAIAAVALLGGIAWALLSAGSPTPPEAGASPSRSTSPSPSPSPSPTESPTASVDAVQEAADALLAIAQAGFDSERIDPHAVDEIRHGVEEALKKFEEGQTEKALEELGKLGEKVEELVNRDEIENSERQRLLKAIDDLAGLMRIAGGDEDD